MLTISATPLPTMTVDALGALMRDLAVFELSADFTGLPGIITVTTDEHRMHEAVNIITGAKMTLADVRYDAHKSFREAFGDKLPLDDERVTVYVTMCREGRI